MKRYSISGWGKHFEIYDAKRIDGPLKWVAVPTKTDGFGFSRIRMEKDSCQLLAAWYLILGVAAKQEKATRGILQRDGQPLTEDDMELMTGFPAKIFKRAFDFFSKQKQGWLLVEEVPNECPLSASTGQDRTGQNNTGQLGCAVGTAPASDSEWLESLTSNEAYRGINVRTEFAKMQAWCAANRKQPSRRRFINWLNRAERPIAPTANYSPAKVDPEPTGWRDQLRAKYPDARADITWGELPANIKKELSP